MRKEPQAELTVEPATDMSFAEVSICAAANRSPCPGTLEVCASWDFSSCKICKADIDLHNKNLQADACLTSCN